MDSQKYLFVNLTQDKMSKDRKTAKEIRTYVMQDIGKARRKRKNVQVPLKLRSSPLPLAQSIFDISMPVDSIVDPTGRRLQGEDMEVESHTPERSAAVDLSRPFWNQNPLQILDDGWGMDPFAMYAMALALNGNTTSQSRLLKPTLLHKIRYRH